MGDGAGLRGGDFVSTKGSGGLSGGDFARARGSDGAYLPPREEQNRAQDLLHELDPAARSAPHPGPH
eukprot:8210337-Pyramimonas_sp.AAC.1